MDALKDRYETVDPVRISICTRVRFLPECYLASCRLDRDPQAEYLLYIRSLINEDE